MYINTTQRRFGDFLCIKRNELQLVGEQKREKKSWLFVSTNMLGIRDLKSSRFYFF